MGGLESASVQDHSVVSDKSHLSVSTFLCEVLLPAAMLFVGNGSCEVICVVSALMLHCQSTLML